MQEKFNGETVIYIDANLNSYKQSKLILIQFKFNKFMFYFIISYYEYKLILLILEYDYHF